MKNVTYTCDFCNEEYSEYAAYTLVLQSKDRSCLTYDICPKCREMIIRMVLNVEKTKACREIVEGAAMKGNAK